MWLKLKTMTNNLNLFKSMMIGPWKMGWEIGGSVTEPGGVVHNKLLQKGSPLSVSRSSSPPRTTARFTMPATRGKTSLNARDW